MALPPWRPGQWTFRGRTGEELELNWLDDGKVNHSDRSWNRLESVNSFSNSPNHLDNV